MVFEAVQKLYFDGISINFKVSFDIFDIYSSLLYFQSAEPAFNSLAGTRGPLDPATARVRVAGLASSAQTECLPPAISAPYTGPARGQPV
jgi:hypothetical protein